MSWGQKRNKRQRVVVVGNMKEGVCEYCLERVVWVSEERLVRMWTQGARERVEATGRQILGGDMTDLKGNVRVAVLVY